MIFKAFEINKINLSKYNLYLFYGENEGIKMKLLKTNLKYFILIEYIDIMKKKY